MFSTPYSAGDSVPVQSYTYDRDALGRAVDLYSGTPQQATSLVTGVSYSGAGRMLGMTLPAVPGVTGYTETRQYNANRQLTRQTAAPTAGQGMDLTYNYGTAANNGRVASVTDNLSGEQVTYTYDQLNRLTQAMTNDAWGLSFGYDGFGNLTQQTRVQGTTAPTMSVTVDPGTNRIATAGYGYDANGNMTQTPDGRTYGYDVANRMVSNAAVYNPKNQRVFDGTYLYYYGVGGELIGKYQPSWGFILTVEGVAYTPVTLQDHQPNLYFGGRAIRLQGHGAFVMTDRLGSVRVNGNGQRMNYYPYGAEVGTETGEGRVKFGTYTRDSAGVDYADQRYYAVGMGRFNSPDPGGMKTAIPSDPTSWNRYAYVGGDPINFDDRTGRIRNVVGNCGDLVNGEPQDGCDGGGGGDSSGDTCGYWEVGFFETMCPSSEGPDADSGRSRPIDYATDRLARGDLGKRLQNFGSSNCAKVFGQVIGSFSGSKFVGQIDSTEFYNARSAGFGGYSQDDVAGNGDATSLNSSLPYGQAARTLWGPLANVVLLGPNFFSDTATGQGNTLMHELLHAYTHWSDDQIFSKFQGKGLQHNNPGTGDITSWISTDCKSTPAGVH